ncbi:MAG: glycosyltransferase family 2 protein [Bacteroidetes bacterium]|nr:glycosyltransferase family 2 protein [Bacteroidota bacterium]
MYELTIIIPAYNEENSLKQFLPEVISFCEEKKFKLIVVNDGSSDGTQKVLKIFSSPVLFIIHNKLNKGYGGAIKTGVAAAETTYCITIDADGQHELKDVEKLFNEIKNSDADMVVGRRSTGGNAYRNAGRSLIRSVAKLLMPVHIHDLNSGMKIYNTALAKKYLHLCPNTMAYSDVIALVFISQRHLVKEIPVTIHPRTSGTSTINTLTAFETLKQILNIVLLFNPMRVFFPLSVFFILVSIAWGLPIVLKGNGVSVGAMLGIITGIVFFLLGLLAEQLSLIRKNLNG